MRSLSKCGAVEPAARCLAAEAASEVSLEEAKVEATVPMDETDRHQASVKTSSLVAEPKVCGVVVRTVVQVGAEALRWAETLTPLDKPEPPVLIRRRQIVVEARTNE
jgi:hypothetical protein